MFSRLILTATAILALALFAGNRAASAQVATPAATASINPDCTPGKLISSLSTMKSTGDQTQDLTALLTLRDTITAQEAACGGLYWKGDSNKSIGPVTIPAGTYLAHLVTTGFFTAKAVTLDGDCGFDSALLFNLFPGAAKDGIDVTFTSAGCKVLFTLSGVSDPYTLAITVLQ